MRLMKKKKYITISCCPLVLDRCYWVDLCVDLDTSRQQANQCHHINAKGP